MTVVTNMRKPTLLNIHNICHVMIMKVSC